MLALIYMINYIKFYVLICFTLFSINAISQVYSFDSIPEETLKLLPNMGEVETTILDSCEGSYLNFIYESQLNGFDLRGKKVGFIHGGAISSKSEYFELERTRFSQNDSPNKGILYLFNSQQRSETGFDAAIAFWCKIYIPIDQVVEKLLRHGKI